MALLGKIRNRAGLIITFILLALAAFILGDLLNSSRGFMGPPKDSVGTLAGEKLPYEEFSGFWNKEFNKAVKNNPEMAEFQKYQILDQSWNTYVQLKLYDKEMKSIGLAVPASEVSDMMTGTFIDPEITQIPAFKDSLGRFSPDAVKAWMEASQNPDHPYFQLAQDIIPGLIEYLDMKRREQKYLGLLSAGLMVSSNEAKVKHEENNLRYNISFLGVNYNVIPDSTVQPTDKDYQAYYNAHKESYKQKPAIQLEYARFPISASYEDSIKVYNKLKELATDFQNSEDDSSFVFQTSAQPTYDTLYKAPENLPAELAPYIAGVSKDTVFGPFIGYRGYNLYKVSDVKTRDEFSVRARHILIKPLGFTPQDSANAQVKAREVRDKVIADRGSFSNLAFAESQDRNTQTTGGDLGWVLPTAFGDGFYESVSVRGEGEVFVTKSNQGWHVVEIIERTRKSFQVQRVFENFYPGKETMDSIYAQAARFLGLASQSGELGTAATNMQGVNIRSTEWISLEAADLPGFTNARNIVYKSFRMKEGDISTDVLSTDSDYFVVKVKKKREDGYQSLEDVKELMDKAVRNQIKAKQISEKLASIGGTDLNQIKEAYGQGAFVSDAKAISFNASSISMIGNDPAIQGEVFGMELNQLSKPLEGKTGVYLVQVTEIKPAPELADATLAATKRSFVANKQSIYANKVRSALREIAELKDERYNWDF